MKNKSEEKTIAFTISTDLHKEVKVKLAQQGLTLKGWLIDLMVNELGKKESIEQEQDNKDLKKIRENAKAILTIVDKIEGKQKK